MVWEDNILKKFKLLISKIPVFHRHITESVVSKVVEHSVIGAGHFKIPHYFEFVSNLLKKQVRQGR